MQLVQPRGVPPFAFISRGSKITCFWCTSSTVKMGAHHSAMTPDSVSVAEPLPPTTATRCYTLCNEDANGTMQGCRRVCEIGVANGTPRSSGPPRRTSSRLPTPGVNSTTDTDTDEDGGHGCPSTKVKKTIGTIAFANGSFNRNTGKGVIDKMSVKYRTLTGNVYGAHCRRNQIPAGIQQAYADTREFPTHVDVWYHVDEEGSGKLQKHQLCETN